MITGNPEALTNAIHLSDLGFNFSSKPVIHGGLAMEYYGLRKRGADIDFIISDDDYQVLAKKYPECRKDMWGDLGLLIGEYELFRSVCRLDYDFYAQGAAEYDDYKVISFEKLFFMKTTAYYHQPEMVKHTKDFELTLNYVYDTFQNKDYAENAKKHIDQYVASPNGTVFKGNYFNV